MAGFWVMEQGVEVGWVFVPWPGARGKRKGDGRRGKEERNEREKRLKKCALDEVPDGVDVLQVVIGVLGDAGHEVGGQQGAMGS